VARYIESDLTNRRKFLIASAAAAASAASAWPQEPKPQVPVSKPDLPVAPGVKPSGFAFDEWTMAELQARIKQGELTAHEICSRYLERIEEIDRRGPTLRSVIEINPDALAIARRRDEEHRAKGPRGPLHGIPVLLKDNIDTADRMQTSAGSLGLVGQPAPKDSWVAERLRAAGAIILGKTNLSEWANFRSTHSTSGWSGRGGQTKNPYALDRNPCGSSSGSGVAVSANLCAGAVGTETDGSIVCPSSMCGIVGIKPTLGLISRAGIIPIAHSQDTAGPMARTVRDAALLLGALVGVDSRDSETKASAGHAFTDYTQFLDPNGLRGARIGIARQYFNIGPAVAAVMEQCIALMRDAGATIVDPADLSSYEAWRKSETEVLLYEFKAGLNQYLSSRGTPLRSLAACIAFNREHPAEEMPFFEQELMEQANEKGPLTEKGYRDALALSKRLARKDGIDALMAKFKLDAIAGPTSGPAWITDLVAGDRTDSGCASPPAVAGYPHITVPAGFKFGLPLGISFFGAAWSEPKLLKIAFAFEQTRRARHKPEYLQTVNFYA
jgi:amidase